MVQGALSGEESHGFHVTWGTTFSGACGGFTLDHYQLVIKEGSTPASPTDGEIVTSNTGSANIRPHRAQRTYYSKLYACDDVSCSDVFGSAGGETITTALGCSDSCYGTTAQEHWEIWGKDYDDGTLIATSPGTSAFFYPTGFGNAGYLGFFYNDVVNIHWKEPTTSGWQNFNAATWSSAEFVAGSHVSDTDYDATTHPYAFPVTVTSGGVTTYETYLLAQNDSTTRHVVWGIVDDGVSQTVDISCASCCYASSAGPCDWPGGESLGYDGVAVDETAWNMADALHGHWMWNLIDDGIPDMTSDTPSILFTGNLDGSTCAVVGGAEDDVYEATWDPSTGWIVRDDDADDCPDPVITDAHDPGITPLPADSYKIYAMDSSHDLTTWYMHDDTIEADTATPQIKWGNAPQNVVTPDCIADVDTFAFVDGSGPHEGMFLYIAETDETFQSGTCTSGTRKTFGKQGVYFARLTN